MDALPVRLVLVAERPSSPAPAAQESYEIPETLMRPVSGAAPGSASGALPVGVRVQLDQRPQQVADGLPTPAARHLLVKRHPAAGAEPAGETLNST